MSRVRGGHRPVVPLPRPTMAEQLIGWWEQKRAALAYDFARSLSPRPQPVDGASWLVWAIDAGKEGM